MMNELGSAWQLVGSDSTAHQRIGFGSSILRADYGALLVDPPWQFRSWSDKGRNRCPDAMVRQKGLAERHYSVMSQADLTNLPIASIAASDSVLFMWIVACHLPEGLELGTAWGVKFKGLAVDWVKQTKDSDGLAFGMGYWTRQQTEQCWLFTRGHPKVNSHSVRQAIMAPRREHSRKPDEIYERVETLVSGPYIELFARHRWPGWDSWGNQLENEHD